MGQITIVIVDTNRDTGWSFSDKYLNNHWSSNVVMSEARAVVLAEMARDVADGHSSDTLLRLVVCSNVVTELLEILLVIVLPGRVSRMVSITMTSTPVLSVSTSSFTSPI